MLPPKLGDGILLVQWAFSWIPVPLAPPVLSRPILSADYTARIEDVAIGQARVPSPCAASFAEVVEPKPNVRRLLRTDGQLHFTPKMPVRNNSWTVEEDAALILAVQEKVSFTRLSVRLRRTASAVRSRIRTLGLPVHRAARLPHNERHLGR